MNPTPVQMRFAVAGDTPAVMAFFRRQWGENHIFGNDQDFLLWQFGKKDAPFGESGALSALTVWEGDRLVGMQGLCYAEFKTPQGQRPGVWLCNLMVAEDYRDKGVSLRLMSGVHRLPVGVIATVGINPLLVPLYKKMRFTVLDDLPRMVLPVHPTSFKALTGFDATVTARDVAEGNGSLTVQTIRHFGEEWNRLFEEISGTRYFGVNRTSTYMNWRYLEHPRFHYCCVAVIDASGRYQGASIFRIEVVQGQAEVVLRVVEFWARDPDSASCLAAYIGAVALENRAAFADHYTTSPETIRMLAGAGWRPASQLEMPVPALFQPLDRRKRVTAVAVRATASLGPLLGEEADLFVLKSDGDQDRPN